jgi:DNA-binding transcriptional regulator GbsR (MarR family)
MKLTPIEIDTIDFFVRLASLFHISRSIGEIYGLLFASPQPVSADYVREKLRISAGSASQGLRLLRTVGAVKVTYVPGERRDFYVAETHLRTIVAGVIRERIVPQLSDQDDRLARLAELLGELPESNRGPLEERIRSLHNWRQKAGAILPTLVERIGREEERLTA